MSYHINDSYNGVFRASILTNSRLGFKECYGTRNGGKSGNFDASNFEPRCTGFSADFDPEHGLAAGISVAVTGRTIVGYPDFEEIVPSSSPSDTPSLSNEPSSSPSDQPSQSSSPSDQPSQSSPPSDQPSQSSSPSDQPSQSSSPSDSRRRLADDVYGKVVIYSNPGGTQHEAEWEANQATLYGGTEDSSFGQGVAISKDGSTVAIGSPLHTYASSDNTGMVHMFEFIEGNWNQKGSDINSDVLNVLDLGIVQAFGERVGISHDGKSVAIAAPLSDTTDANVGALFVYEWNNDAADWMRVIFAEYGTEANQKLGYGGVAIDTSNLLLHGVDSQNKKYSFQVSVYSSTY